MRARSLTMVGAALALAWGCSDEGNRFLEPTIERAVVAGVYDLTLLTFDPEGSLPEKSLLALFPAQDRPILLVSDTAGTFQLRFRDPIGGQFEDLAGTYEIRGSGIRLQFGSPADAQRLLFTQPLDLSFDPDARTLAAEGSAEASIGRLKELVPEFRDEYWIYPVPGRLKVLFTVNG